MILIISSPDDVHALNVSKKLTDMQYPNYILDLEQFGHSMYATYSIGQKEFHEIKTISGEVVPLDEILTIWHRRPRLPKAIDTILDKQIRAFAVREWNALLDGIFITLDAFFVNSPLSQSAAIKPKQLQVAKKVGLNIPETIITNDFRYVHDMLTKFNRNIIHKSIGATGKMLLETREWTDNTDKYLNDLFIAPSIFQEKILGAYDVRITVVGKQIFSALIYTRESRSKIDSRLDLDAKYEMHHLPEKIHEKILLFMKEMNLVFGTVDMKITDNGEYIFFEVNPQGQYLYVELLTGMPISSAMAELLCYGAIK